MSEMSIMGFVGVLNSIRHALENGGKDDLKEAAEVVKAEAQSAIGTYKYGWPPLSPETVARKGADTPLLQTGAYRASFEAVVTSNHEAHVGSNDPKAQWLEFGTPKMPPRPVLPGAIEATRAQVHRILERSFVRRLFGGS